MTVPVIPQFTDLPVRGTPREIFTPAVNQTFSEFPEFITQTNAAAELTNENAEAAQAAADFAAGAIAAANFKGNWSAQTGAANKPYSVFHSDAFWALANNLANVTTSQPGVTADWVMIDRPLIKTLTRTSNTVLGFVDAGKTVRITSGTFSQTFAACATLGNGWFCYLENVGTGVITLDPNASQTIDGATTKVLKKNTLTLVLCDGSALRTIEYQLAGIDSAVVAITGNGHGSTNTKIRRFTTTQLNVGNAITYADSATLGASFTIVESGIYQIDYFDNASSGGFNIGISLNSSQLTTSMPGINASDIISYTQPGSSNKVPVSACVRLEIGDVVRPHTDGIPAITTFVKFSIRKIGA